MNWHLNRKQNELLKYTCSLNGIRNLQPTANTRANNTFKAEGIKVVYRRKRRKSN